jgi:hypothetical protein
MSNISAAFHFTSPKGLTIYDYAQQHDLKPAQAKYHLEKMVKKGLWEKTYDTICIEVFHTLASYRDHDVSRRRFAVYHRVSRNKKG